MNTETTINLKELREKFPHYIEAIAQGQSFIVLKRSKPIFQINPVNDEGNWMTIADFTTISDKGVLAEDLLEAF